MSRWGDDKTLKLVTLYQSHECLWNPRSAVYKNNIARNNAYSDLIANIDTTLTIKTLKTKIKNLRSVYHSEVKKIENSKRSGSGAAEVYSPSMLWFHEMHSFLRDNSDYRETVSSEWKRQELDLDESSQGSRPTDTDSNLNRLSPQSVIDMSPRSNNPTSDVRSQCRWQSGSYTSTQRKRKIIQEEPITLALERLENISSAINKPAEYDEFHFLNLNVSIALPLYESLDVQTVIQTILAAARRRHLQVLPKVSAYSTNTNASPITSKFYYPDTQTLTSTFNTSNAIPITNLKTVTKFLTPSTQITRHATYTPPVICTFPATKTHTVTSTPPKITTHPFSASKTQTITSTHSNIQML